MRHLALLALLACGNPVAAVPTTATPRPTPAPVVRDDAIGTADPILLVAAATNGRWVVACQARADTDGVDGTRVPADAILEHYDGDRLHAYLFRGGGRGTPVDAFVAASPDERWLAIRRDGQLLVVDDRTGRAVALRGADLAAGRGVAASAEFDHDSRHVIYFRSRGAGTRIQSEVVVRTLATGHERVWSVPPGLIARLAPERGSAWARVELVVDDGDGNGALEGQDAMREGARGHRCESELGSATRPPGDQARVLWLNLASGEVDEDDAVLGFVGDERIVRTADRAIQIGDRTIVPADCGALLVAVLAEPLRVAVECRRRGRTIEIFGPDVHLWVLGRQRPRARVVTSANPREGQIVDGLAVCDVACFRMTDGVVLAPYGSRLLPHDRILFEDRHAIVDAGSERVTDVVLPADDMSEPAGDHVAFGRTIVDTARAQVVGEVMRTPLALDTAGRALLPATGCNHELCVGPLRWEAPRPASPEPPPSDARDQHFRYGTLSGTVVDDAGAPIAGARFAASTEFSDIDYTYARFATRRAGVIVHEASSMPFAPGVQSDAGGRFAVPDQLGEATLLAIAPDGRIGLLVDLPAAQAGLVVTLRRGSQVHVRCDERADKVALARRALVIEARCGDTITGVPAGRYRALGKTGEREVLQDLEVAGGGTSELRLVAPVTVPLEVRVVTYPGGAPIAGATCRADDATTHSHVDAPRVSGPDGSIAFAVQPGDYQVACEDARFAAGVARATAGTRADVPVVRYRRGGVALDVSGEREPRGLRIAYAAGRAVRAGLRGGDLVTAADGVALAGLTEEGMLALAFEVPPDEPARWTVERAGQTLTLDSPAW